MRRATDRPTTVEDYLAGFPGARSGRLCEIRSLCLAAAPDAKETLKWGAPAYVASTILFQFAGYKAHATVVVTPSAKDAFEGEFGEFETGKGSLKIPYAAPLPSELITAMLEHRVREYTERGVLWM